MLNRVQRAIKNRGLMGGQQHVTRMLLALAIVGCLFGFTGTRQSVAAAGWNHFIDPVCAGSMHGTATPGINWNGYAFTSSAKARSVLYFQTIYGWQIQDEQTSAYVYSGDGDIRYYLSGYSNSPGTWQGEVFYWTTFAGNGNYNENIYNC